MIYFTASNSALVFLDSLPTRQEFLARAGVLENSYAGMLMLNFYDEIFVYSKNLRDEYIKYYKIEYPEFSEFADAFCSIPSNVTPKIDSYFQRYPFIIHFGLPGFLEGGWDPDNDPGAVALPILLNTKIAK